MTPEEEARLQALVDWQNDPTLHPRCDALRALEEGPLDPGPLILVVKGSGKKLVAAPHRVKRNGGHWAYLTAQAGMLISKQDLLRHMFRLSGNGLVWIQGEGFSQATLTEDDEV